MSQVPLPPSDNPFSAPAGNPSELVIRTLQLKRVDVLSMGKMLASLYVCLGLLVGGILLFTSLLGAVLVEGDAAQWRMFVGAASIVLFPLIYGAIGFVGGIMLAATYNLLASLLGGIELELK